MSVYCAYHLLCTFISEAEGKLHGEISLPPCLRASFNGGWDLRGREGSTIFSII